MENNTTQAWRLYEEGRDYNSRLTPNQYAVVETNTEFFAGNQWLHLPDTPAMRNLPHPVFNIIKRVANLFIASLTSSNVTIRAEALSNVPANPNGADAPDPVRYANAALENLLEKLKFEFRFREALYDGVRTGDFAAHFWFDPDARPFGESLPFRSPPLLRGGDRGEVPRGEIRMELVDGINVMFGNPNSRNTEEQPYILLVGRDTVENLQAEARKHGKHGGEPDAVVSDTETRDMAGVDSGGEHAKALYVLLYTKKAGKGRAGGGAEPTVHVTKATRTAVIYEDIDTGLSVYPLAWGNWERQKNQYHGRALVTEIIPNQIFINTTAAKAARHLDLLAFPKIVFNADRIPAWTNEVGAAIGVHNVRPGERLPEMAYVIPAAEMSRQITDFLNLVMSVTRECLGATDAMSGNVKPDNTSAIMVLQTNAEVPLENIRAELHEWTEDIGRILLDMMGTYYGWRMVEVKREIQELVTGPDGLPRIDPMTGMFQMQKNTIRVPEPFDFTAFKHLWFNLRVDVGGTTYFSETAITQTLDNLRAAGLLSAVQYLERVPDKLIPRKEELLEELRGQAASLEGGASAPAGPIQGGPVSEATAARGVPPAMDSVLKQVNSQIQNKALNLGARRMMG